MSGFGAPALTATPTPARASHHLALLDEIVDHVRIARDLMFPKFEQARLGDYSAGSRHTEGALPIRS